MDSASAFDSLDYLLPSPGPTAAAATSAVSVSVSAAAGAATRGSKKRARASRRAPTTVLTTDASNFRAMVQEFTGIPSPPFPTTSSPSSSSALHLFLPPRTRFEPAVVDNYLLRPFFSSSSSSSSTATTATTAAASTPLAAPLHLQNPILTFQSLLQCSHPALLPPPPTEYGDGVMGLLPGLNGPAGWAADGPLGSCKMNYTTAAAAAAAESVAAAAAAAAARGEGMVESWICSAD